MTKPNKIKISVVIPAYNEEKFLPDCLESLKKQDVEVPFEIIVVDNNSTDRTACIAKTFGARVVLESRQGICFARQSGALEARGDIVVTTDADCIFKADWLENIYKSFKKNKEVVSVLGPFQFSPKPKWGKIYSTIFFNVVRNYHRQTGKLLCAAASNFSFRKNVWLQIGGYNTALTQSGDDSDLLKRLSKKGSAVYLHNNSVLTSSRRLSKGLIYSFFITLISYHFIDYFVIARLTGKSVLGQYPPCREHYKRNWVSSASTVLLVLLVISLVFKAKTVEAKNLTLSDSKRIISSVKGEAVEDIGSTRVFKEIHHRALRIKIHA